jgi:hypothetical protein
VLFLETLIWDKLMWKKINLWETWDIKKIDPRFFFMPRFD